MIYIASNVVGHCNPSRAQTWTGRVPLRKSDLPVPLPANAHLRLVAPPRSTDAPTEPLPALRVLGHEPNHVAKIAACATRQPFHKPRGLLDTPVDAPQP